MSQPELIAAILREIGRQDSGAMVDQERMNVVIRAADEIVAAFEEQEPQP